ncbi:MAG TPA: cytidylate kinase family protein [Tepidisphaeraceae bacterium]|nr:cytidylate kinase family protein [Tepidisphaeraceae bacterium]
MRLITDGYSKRSAQDLLREAVCQWKNADRGLRPAEPFVTISRQPSTGVDALPGRLAMRLKHEQSGDWSIWDHSLISKTSSAPDIARGLERVIAEQPEGWMQELADGYVIGLERCNPAEFTVYRRVTAAIRSLAAAGRVIIVGQGGMFVTHGMQSGIRVRIVAPIEHRIQCMADEFELTRDEAAGRVAQADHGRDVFFHRYWPGRVVTPEAFAATFNTAEMSIDDIVEGIVSILRARQAMRARKAHLRLA